MSESLLKKAQEQFRAVVVILPGSSTNLTYRRFCKFERQSYLCLHVVQSEDLHVNRR